MTHGIKVPTTEPAHLSLIPGTHVIEGDNLLTPVSCPLIFIGILSCAHPTPQKINKCNKKFETAVTVFLGFADTFLERTHICKFLIPEQCGLAILLLPMLHCVFSGQMV